VTRARDLMLHPLALAAVAVLVANDHWWKASHPGWWTGKLSDIAGLAFFPLLVLVIAERVVASRARALALAITVTATGFAWVKTVPVASALFGHVLGVAQWPGAAIVALWHGTPIAGPIAAGVVTDPTDLLALPAVAVAVIVARRRGYISLLPAIAPRSTLL
jgi:hypothetical protein